MNTKNRYLFTSNFEEFISLTYISLLLLSFVFPKGKVLDVMGIQWLFMGILNFLTGITLLIYKKKVPNFNFFQFNSITILYSIFILLCGISITYATNFLEGLLPFVKLLNIFCVFFILSIFANNDTKILNKFAILVTLSLFFEAFLLLFQYYRDIEFKNANLLRNILKTTAGNVNFLASSITLKLPFVVYLIFTQAKDNWIYKSTYFLGILLLLPLTSRTNNLNLILLLLLIPIFLLAIKQLKFHIKNLAFIYFASILAFGIYKTQINYINSNNKTTISKNWIDKVELEKKLKQNEIFDNELLNSGTRFDLWSYSFELWKKNPILGNGLGSYKIDVIPLESKKYNSWRISKHPHNDFIQIAVESGILTSLIYLSIFILIFFNSLKNIRNKSIENEKKWIYFIVLISILIYGIDSLLNFPMHVARNQIQFAFILFLFLISQKENSKKIKSNKLIYFTLFFSLMLTYPNYLYTKSLIGQKKAFNDEGKMGLSYATINQILPNYPSLSERGFQIKGIKAKYLIKENKFDEALKLLNESDYENKYHTHNQYVKSLLYEKKGAIDSVIKYKKIGFEMYPIIESKFKFYLIYLKKANRLNEMKEAKNYADKYIKSKKYDSIYNQILNSKVEDLPF